MDESATETEGARGRESTTGTELVFQFYWFEPRPRLGFGSGRITKN
jgi:hypothetical protein